MRGSHKETRENEWFNGAGKIRGSDGSERDAQYNVAELQTYIVFDDGEELESLKRYRGTVWAEHLFDDVGSDGVTLVMDDGSELPIMVSSHNIREGSASINGNGSIQPGS